MLALLKCALVVCLISSCANVLWIFLQAELGSKLSSVDAKTLDHIGTRLAHVVCSLIIFVLKCMALLVHACY
jgi:hypothetical protein